MWVVSIYDRSEFDLTVLKGMGFEVLLLASSSWKVELSSTMSKNSTVWNYNQTRLASGYTLIKKQCYKVVLFLGCADKVV